MKRPRLATFFALVVPISLVSYRAADLGPFALPEFQFYGKLIAAAVPIAAGAIWLGLASMLKVDAVRRIFPISIVSYLSVLLVVETATTMMPIGLLREPSVLSTAGSWRYPLPLAIGVALQSILALIVVPKAAPPEREK